MSKRHTYFGVDRYGKHFQYTIKSDKDAREPIESEQPKKCDSPKPQETKL